MKNSIIKITTLAILSSGLFFSCNDKEETVPVPVPTTNNTNTLALNTWKITNNGVTTTYSRIDSVKGGLSGIGNPQIIYPFFCNPAADYLSFTFKGNVAPPTGTYKVVGGLVENADEVVVGSTLGAGAIYGTTSFNSKINVTNTAGEILIEANNILFSSFSGNTCTLSAKLKK